MGYNDKPDWLSVKATVTFIKHDGTPYYSACPNVLDVRICEKNMFFCYALDL